MKGRVAVRGSRRAFEGLKRDDGLTIVELMLSIVILGIVFAAVAASLITFTRSSSASELRVEATALMSQLHEDFLLIPWDRAGNLEDELEELVALMDDEDDPLADLFNLEIDLDVSPPEYVDNLEDTRDVVIVEDDGEVTTGGCTDAEAPRRAPRTLIEQCEFNGRVFNVAQIITWVDRSGDLEPDTKRLTTVVAWQWLGRDFVERYDSERAPSSVEVPTVANPRAVPSVTPNVLEVDEDGVVVGPQTELTVVVNFAPAGIVAETADIYFPVLQPDGSIIEESIPLVGKIDTFGPGGFGTFEGTINTIGRAFPTGLQPFRAEAGTSTGEIIDGTTTVEFFVEGEDGDDDDDIVPPAEDVAITSFSAAPSTVSFTDSSFNCALVFTANIQGLTDVDGTATISYSDSSGETQTGTMVAQVTPIQPSGAQFQFTLGTTSSHGFWLPSNGQQVDVTFSVVAARQSDGQQQVDTTTVRLHKNNGNC